MWVKSSSRACVWCTPPLTRATRRQQQSPRCKPHFHPPFWDSKSWHHALRDNIRDTDLKKLMDSTLHTSWKLPGSSQAPHRSYHLTSHQSSEQWHTWPAKGEGDDTIPERSPWWHVGCRLRAVLGSLWEQGSATAAPQAVGRPMMGNEQKWGKDGKKGVNNLPTEKPIWNA